ncbi:MAG: head-tail adaptor protein [Gallionella sp.]|nr:head-tail adaptor protein [Gallionella sp.]
MRAGAMDRQVTVEKKQVTVDPTYGTELVSWIPLVAQAGSPTVAARFWARFRDVLQGRGETVKMDVALSSGRAVVGMRYRSDITSAMRVRLHGDGDDVIYQIITDPVMIGRKEETEFIVERYSS